MAEVGFIDPKDPRFVSTVEALEATLCDGPFMRRYEAPDDFGKPEVAFNVCSFWRIDALARIGRVAQAREIFESLLAHRNHVGLLSEDLKPDNGELWGNFPQTVFDGRGDQRGGAAVGAVGHDGVTSALNRPRWSTSRCPAARAASAP
jgi:GH15 family glucan-1,4-alpha-glucosidase